MGKIQEIKINRFDGGTALDKRQARENQFSKSLNFDIYKNPSRLAPIRDYEIFDDRAGLGAGTAKVLDLSNFGERTSTLYALGHQVDGTGRELFSTIDPNAGGNPYWFTEGLTEATGTPLPGFIITDPAASLLWFVSGSNSATAGNWQLGNFDYNAMTGNIAHTTLTAVTSSFLPPMYPPQAILGQDGSVYVASLNRLYKCNTDGTVTADVITVPSNYCMTSLCLYGNYLAIGLRTRLGSKRISKVVLWDYYSPVFSEVIDAGHGNLMVLDVISGRLVAVVEKNINSDLTYFIAGEDAAMQVKMLSGNSMETVAEVKAAAVTSEAVLQFKFMRGNTLYWYAKIPTNAEGTEFDEGIWAFGQKSAGQPFGLTLYREKAGTAFEGFYGINDYFYLPHSDDGSVSRTNVDPSYNLTASYESPLFAGSGSMIEKTIMGGIYLTFEKLPSGQDISLKYRKDGDVSWTPVLSAPPIQPGDLRAFFPLKTHFKEIEYRVESTGGSAAVTGLAFRWEELASALG